MLYDPFFIVTKRFSYPMPKKAEINSESSNVNCKHHKIRCWGTMNEIDLCTHISSTNLWNHYACSHTSTTPHWLPRHYEPKPLDVTRIWQQKYLYHSKSNINQVLMKYKQYYKRKTSLGIIHWPLHWYLLSFSLERFFFCVIDLLQPAVKTKCHMNQGAVQYWLSTQNSSKPKYWNIPLAHKLFCNDRIVLKLCAAHSNDALCKMSKWFEKWAVWYMQTRF